MTYQITFETDSGNYTVEIESADKALQSINSLTYMNGNCLTAVQINPIVLIRSDAIRKVTTDFDIETARKAAESERRAVYEKAVAEKAAQLSCDYPNNATSGAILGYGSNGGLL